jgi:hypothetical protein
MKSIFFIYVILITSYSSFAQASSAENVFIITIDGMRWQEVFKGADSILLRDDHAVKDTTLMVQQYWHSNLEERRRRLLPFFWSVIQQQGQLLGNRELNNKVNVANLYKISYPGYNEILTGYPDRLFIPNLDFRNPNENILQYLNDQPAYNGKVAAFCSWRVFPFILNEKGGSIPVNAGYEMLAETDTLSSIINGVQQRVANPNNTRHDMLTYECAKNYIEQHHPKVIHLALGETDEFAHHGEYDTYLRKAHQADAMIAELWYYVQTDSFYKNNTSFIITTDHGRGRKTGNWSGHGFWVAGSGETWMALLGSGIQSTGENSEKQQVYQKQIPATVAELLGEKFITNHPVGKSMSLKIPVSSTGSLVALEK